MFFRLKQDWYLRILLAIVAAMYAATPLSANAKCSGKFINPITDVCWECLFPISIGNISLFKNNLPDTDNPSSPICMCPNPIPRVGIAAGFWEPVRLADVTKQPFCFPTLNGMEMNMGFDIGRGGSPHESESGNGFWHIHWYQSPLISWLEIIMEFACLEKASYDLVYISEFDPLWSDDSLSFIINPEAVLFGNPIAQAACAADCVKSSVTSSFDSLFWCAGCQGGLYPMDGHIQAHIGSIQSSLLAVERMINKLHRQLLAWGTSGKQALCQKYPMPIIKKSQYRMQLVAPVPSDCYQFGRSTVPYEGGKEIPVSGEDFGYLVWRKRNCCVL